MIVFEKWMDDLTEYETWCIGQWFNRNGIQTQMLKLTTLESFNIITSLYHSSLIV